MRVKMSKLDLFIIYPDIFTDFRGQYTEIYNHTWFPGVDFIQDSVIISTLGVIRGYHGDYDTWKYVTCLEGKFELSIACIDPQNPMFGRRETFSLDTIDKVAVLIPPKFVNAHQCTSDKCVFFYKQSTLYRGENSQYTVRYDEFFEQWPLIPIISQRDSERAKSYVDYIKDGVLLKPEEVN